MQFILSPFSETTGIVRGGSGFSLLLLSSYFFPTLWCRSLTGCSPFKGIAALAWDHPCAIFPLGKICFCMGPPQAAVPALPRSTSCSSDLAVHHRFPLISSFSLSLSPVFPALSKICFYKGTTSFAHRLSCVLWSWSCLELAGTICVQHRAGPGLFS